MYYRYVDRKKFEPNQAHRNFFYGLIEGLALWRRGTVDRAGILDDMSTYKIAVQTAVLSTKGNIGAN